MLLPIMLLCSSATYVGADCIDIPGIERELRAGIITEGDVQISYKYTLEKNEFSLSWQLGERSGGPFGPFPLTMSCGTPSLKWENVNFLIFERGCGTFCWYVKVFSLALQEKHQTPGYQRIDRPLAFDSKRNLLAYYYSQNLIHVKNLVSGYEQEVMTIKECEFHSGLCFQDVGFNDAELEYTWRSDAAGKKITHPLEKELLELIQESED
jgi:hypothetical protein